MTTTSLAEAAELMRRYRIIAAVHFNRWNHRGVLVTLRRKNTRKNPWSYLQLYFRYEEPTGGGDYIQVNWTDPAILIGSHVTDLTSERIKTYAKGEGGGELLQHLLVLDNGSEFLIIEEHGNDEGQWSEHDDFFTWLKCEIISRPQAQHDVAQRSPFTTPSLPQTFLRDLVNSGLTVEEAIVQVSRQINAQSHRFDDGEAKQTWERQMRQSEETANA